MQVNLLGATWEPALPPSYTARQEVLLAYGMTVTSVPVRAIAAAIGVAWNHPDIELPINYRTAGFDVMEFGGLMNDFLVAQGAHPNEITTAGLGIIDAMNDSIPRQEDVDKTAAFSEGNAGKAEADPPKTRQARRQTKKSKKSAAA